MMGTNDRWVLMTLIFKDGYACGMKLIATGSVGKACKLNAESHIKI